MSVRPLCAVELSIRCQATPRGGAVASSPARFCLNLLTNLIVFAAAIFAILSVLLGVLIFASIESFTRFAITSGLCVFNTNGCKSIWRASLRCTASFTTLIAHTGEHRASSVDKLNVWPQESIDNFNTSPACSPPHTSSVVRVSSNQSVSNLQALARALFVVDNQHIAQKKSGRPATTAQRCRRKTALYRLGTASSSCWSTDARPTINIRAALPLGRDEIPELGVVLAKLSDFYPSEGQAALAHSNTLRDLHVLPLPTHAHQRNVLHSLQRHPLTYQDIASQSP